jgi:hypothetical protein
VRDEEQLNAWTWKLGTRGMQYVEFREPDIGNELTAIATVTDRKIFSRLELL